MRNPFRRRPATAEWLPLPYEQAILMPEPVWPDWSGALTVDCQQFLALEPQPRQPLDPPAVRARQLRRQHRR